MNDLIAAHNERVDRHQDEVSAARLRLEESDVVEGMGEYHSREDAIKEMVERFSRLQRVNRQLHGRIAKLEASVRRHQRPANELTRELAAYLGHEDFTFEVLDTGYIVKRNGKLAKKLSEGEKTAIAILYFLKSLSDNDFNSEAGTIVIDDPVSSLDASSLYCAFGYIQSRTANCGQLFLLTHNFTLFRLAKAWLKHLRIPAGPPQSSFYMLRTEVSQSGRNSRIARLDPLLSEFESDYHFMFKAMVSFAISTASSSGECYSIANTSRRLLEAFMAFRFPSSSKSLDGKLQEIEYDVAKKTRMLRFLHVNSHADRIGDYEHDPSPLLEASEIVRDLLDMMRQEDAKHFDGLCIRVGHLGYRPR